MNRIDYAGMKTGKLTVMELLPPNENHRRLWRSECECGNKNYIVTGGALRLVKSCGCGCRENQRAIGSRRSTMRPDGEAARWVYYTSVRTNAKRRGITFNLKLEDFLKITGSACSYCGREWSSEYPNRKGKGKTNGTYKHNGIDRIDSNIGYVLDNCTPCCADCNIAKQRMSIDQFKVWIARVYEHICTKSAGVPKAQGAA